MGSTIKDVARVSGISVTTISKYLNGVPVRKTTSEKISRAIEELGYRPNPLARGLRNSSTMTFGILVDDITNTFYTSIISLVTEHLRSYEYSCLIHEVPAMNILQANEAVDFLSSKCVDGLFILSNRIPDSLTERLNNSFHNIVIIDSYVNGLAGDFVLTDNLAGAYHGTEQFLIRNHKKIAIITGHPDNYTANERLNGYIRAMQDYGVPICDELVCRENYDMDGGYKAFNRLLQLSPEERPSAVLISSYFMTIGAIIAVNKHNVKIPDDRSVICFDNYDRNKVFKPALTSVAQPVEDISRKAVEFMLDQVQNDSTESQIARLPPQFIQGASVRTI